MVNTITGTDMKVFFGIKKIYITAGTTTNYKTLANEVIWFDAGTVTQIRYSAERDVTPKYLLTSLDPVSLSTGVVFTQGDIIFKNFNQDSVKALFNAIVIAGAIQNNSTLLDNAKNKVNTFDLTNGAFTQADISAILADNAELSKIWSDTIENWDEMPFFDIKVIAKPNDYASTKELVYLDILDVKITDVGFSESIDSTEVNDIVKFTAIGGIDSWKRGTGGGM